MSIGLVCTSRLGYLRSCGIKKSMTPSGLLVAVFTPQVLLLRGVDLTTFKDGLSGPSSLSGEVGNGPLDSFKGRRAFQA